MKPGLSAKEERLLLSLERRLDLLQRESRAALGEVRSLMQYHIKHSQLKIIGYIPQPEYRRHHKSNLEEDKRQ